MDDIKRKIRSLLTVAAEGSGAMEAERATARSLADKLMVKHGLKETDIPERQKDAPKMPAYSHAYNDFSEFIRRMQQLAAQQAQSQWTWQQQQGLGNSFGYTNSSTSGWPWR